MICKDIWVGRKIHIDWMQGEPRYTDKEGVVEYVDDAGQLHGTWGGLAVCPEVDEFHSIGGSDK